MTDCNKAYLYLLDCLDHCDAKEFIKELIKVEDCEGLKEIHEKIETYMGSKSFSRLIGKQIYIEGPNKSDKKSIDKDRAISALLYHYNWYKKNMLKRLPLQQRAYYIINHNPIISTVSRGISGIYSGFLKIKGD